MKIVCKSNAHKIIKASYKFSNDFIYFKTIRAIYIAQFNYINIIFHNITSLNY